MFFGALAILVVIILVAVFLGTSYGRHWRSERYVARSKALAAADKMVAARLAVMRALQLDGNSLSATRQMLELVPQGDLHAELLLRCRVADLDEPDAKNLERVVFLAMIGGRFDLAENALASLQRRGIELAMVFEFEIRLRLIRGQYALAQSAAVSLLQIDPKNLPAKLVLALVGLQGLPDSQLNEVEQSFLSLVDDPVTRLEALRGLREVKRRKGDLDAALESANAVVKEQWSNFYDWIVRAGLMLKIGGTDITALRDELLEKANHNLGNLELIVLWLNQNGGETDIVSWLEGIDWLVKEVGAKGALLAGEWSRRGDWKSMAEAPILDAPWPSHEHVRLAYKARAFQNLRKESEGFQLWTAAMNSVRDDSKASRDLAKLTQRWPEWGTRYLAFLWQATTTRPENLQWVFDLLQEYYFRERSTEGVLRVNRAKLSAFPDNLLAKRNIVLCLLLLNIEKEEARRRLFELKQFYPASSAVVALDALASLREEKPANAVLALAALPDEAYMLEDVALVRAIALKQTGADAEAKEALKYVKFANLMKEERAMLVANGLLSGE